MPIAKSQLSAIVATQLGKLQGEVEARIQTEALKEVNKFANSCPFPEELAKIAATANNLISVINNFQNKVNKFSQLPNKLKPAIQIAKIVIKLLKTNPAPVAIGTPPGPSGGLIIASTTGTLTSFADKLNKITQLLESLEYDVEGIVGVVNSINPSLEQVKSILERLAGLVQTCAEELSQNNNPEDLPNLAKLVKSLQPLENTGSEGIPNVNFQYRSINGKDYTLSILSEPLGINVVPRRYAVAKDVAGTVVLKGQPSFSSSTKVLLDELKFRIDNQLP